uniref:Uncharacterized protein n=1 Tax=Arundo donax TaxID=35708 RepID=A0A0A8YK55_ARUDO
MWSPLLGHHDSSFGVSTTVLPPSSTPLAVDNSRSSLSSWAPASGGEPDRYRRSDGGDED